MHLHLHIAVLLGCVTVRSKLVGWPGFLVGCRPSFAGRGAAAPRDRVVLARMMHSCWYTQYLGVLRHHLLEAVVVGPAVRRDNVDAVAFRPPGQLQVGHVQCESRRDVSREAP